MSVQPIVEFRQVNIKNSDKDFGFETEQLMNGLRNEGFVYITDIPGFDEDELFRLTNKLFALEAEKKMAIAKHTFNSININHYRGYFPLIPGGHSYKEAFEFGSFNFPLNNGKGLRMTSSGRPYMQDVLHEPNVWPEFDTETETHEFKTGMQTFFTLMTSVSQRLLKMLSMGMGMKEDFWEHFCGRGDYMSTFRLLHYPTRTHLKSEEIPPVAREEDGTLVTTGQHSDTSFMTLLSTFQNPGLQVHLRDPKIEGAMRWVDVPNRKNCLVMNIGRLLAKLTDGELQATMHRVVDIGEERYSAPYFFEPSFFADISRTVSGQEMKEEGEDEIEATKRHIKETSGGGERVNEEFKWVYGPWMACNAAKFAEWKTTDFGIPIRE
ncbi:probable iron/ascorbate oxidoreductase DDB_G0283291 [Symsagittifera roscoffensis]|uniref:probable iron/ascorbate oxidoreductase DDB_G0283291 n=1 Tax=Symsagittifera roscoffensis TaxID=84072 RepID=UPI00307CA9AB